MNEEIEFTENERKVIAALSRLEKLWEKYGDGLILYNGHSLRRNTPSRDNEIASFPGIIGDGGDGGDCF